MAGYDDSQRKATAKYNKKTYDDLKIRVPKGMRETYKQQADRKGMSLNTYIVSLIEKDMERD